MKMEYHKGRVEALMIEKERSRKMSDETRRRVLGASIVRVDRRPSFFELTKMPALILVIYSLVAFYIFG